MLLALLFSIAPLVIVLSGGFVVDAGPLHLSLRHWRRPLALDLLLWLAALAVDRGPIVQALRAVSTFIESRAWLIAIVLAAAVAGVGVRYGGFAAAGADAGGYLSEAELLSQGHVSYVEPLAQRAGWPEATWDFAPLGYRPSGPVGRIVPTYPPGLPLLFVPARLLFGEWGPFFVVPLLGALAVIGAYGLGRRLHSPLAGLTAAVLTASSPIFQFQLTQPMSDVPAAGWSTLALLLATRSSPLSIVGAGFAGGLAVMTRPAVGPLLLVVLLVVLLGVPTAVRRWPRLIWFVLGGTPAAIALGALQRAMYGGAAASGYGEPADYFSGENIRQNLADYTWRIVIGEWPALLLALVAAFVCVAGRRHLRSRISLHGLAIGVAAFLVVLATYLPYGVFVEWSYLRFLLPALPALFVAIAVVAVPAIAVLPGRLDGLLTLVVVAVVGAANLAIADHHSAWDIRLGESRYQLTGMYVAAAVHPSTVLVTSQESVALHHYTGLPVLRWDQLHTSLETALDFLRREGRHPVFVIEDWEHEPLRKRFPQSDLARLDWPPRAHIGDQTHVYVYDVDDRGTRTLPVDRIHSPE